MGKFERAGIDGFPTEQRCLETWSEKQGLLHPCKAALALNFEIPVCCIEEALRSSPAFLDDKEFEIKRERDPGGGATDFDGSEKKVYLNQSSILEFRSASVPAALYP